MATSPSSCRCYRLCGPMALLLPMLCGTATSLGPSLPPRLARAAAAAKCDQMPVGGLVDSVGDGDANVEGGKGNGTENESLGVAMVESSYGNEGTARLNVDLAMAALECLFVQWYPAPESEEYLESTLLDVDGEGTDLGAVGTYGEVSPVGGVAALLDTIAGFGAALGPDDVFADLGSGQGRLALQLFLMTDVGRTLGVEIGVRRHRLARAAGRVALGIGPTMYGVGVDSRVYAQALDSMSPATDWKDAAQGPVQSIAAWANMMYAVGPDKRVYKQSLSSMSPETTWVLASKGSMETIVVHDGILYGAGTDQRVWKQNVSSMSPKTNWTLAGTGFAIAVAVWGDIIYVVGSDMCVWNQSLSSMDPSTNWVRTSKGTVSRIAIHGDVIYAVAYDNRVWKQALISMSLETDWRLAALGDVVDVSASLQGVIPQASSGSSAIEFLHGDVLREVRRWQQASVVHVSSLRFDASLMTSLGLAISATMLPGTLVFSLRDFPGCPPGLLYVGSVEVPVTWSPQGNKLMVFTITPPPVLPQPVWLDLRAPLLDAALQFLGGSWKNEEEPSVSWAQWVEACTHTWPGTTNGMLRRLMGAAPTALGVAAGNVDGAVDLATLEAIAKHRLRGTPWMSPVQCAWCALEVRARQVADTNSSSMEALDSLIPLIGDLGAIDDSGRTLVWLAAGEYVEPLAELALARLLGRRAPADVVSTRSGSSPLGRAVRRNNTAVVRMLLAHRVATNTEERLQRQPLHYAALYGHVAASRLLLEYGARPDMMDGNGITPRHLVANGEEDLLQALANLPGSVAGGP